MSNDDNRPRRDLGRPEDNPFIAFRRFADSQVSSLLNTVFTLPATIANYNNAHLAREECLFGKGDKKQCEKLRVIEDEITALRHEGRESFRIGDVQAVLRASEELMRLDREADGLRKGIVGDATTTNDGRHGKWRDERMIEQFANKKGQEWGWMWDWGFPRPFDYDNSSRDMSECQRDNEMREAEAILRLQSEVQRLVAAFDGKTWDDRDDQMNDDSGSASDDGRPRVWSWSRSWQWPPPADAGREEYSPRALESDHQLRKTGIPWQEAYEDLLREEHRPSSSHAPDEPSYEYAHDHEDQHDDPPTPKNMQAARFPVHQGAVPERDFKEVGSIAEEVFQKVLEMQHQERSGQATRMLQEEDKTANRLALPLPEDEASEMDAYEHLQLQQATSQATSSAGFLEKHAHESNTRPSILSTLTTTERTVAPDGSVTTKTILKRRFADGKEESAETVHVQHIHDTENSSQPARSNTPSDLGSPKGEDVQKRKRPSWFWSS